jgi:general stress protein 26
MRTDWRAVVWVLLTSLAAGAAGAQDKAAAPSRSAFIAAAREIITASRYCTMVTNGLDGQPQARIIDAFAPESSLVVWIATKAASRKVVELRADPRVTLVYFNTAASEYVSLQGTATFSTDVREREAHWKPDWAAFYDDQWRGADYLLIRVRPARLEVVSARAGFQNDPRTWRPAWIDLP